MTGLRDRLRGGDRRSIGDADAVAAEVLRRPAQFAALIAAMRDPDRVVRMRSADAAEKASRARPDLLAPHGAELLRLGASDEAEIRWHVAQMLPRAGLDARSRRSAVRLLTGYLDDASAIVVANALSALDALDAHEARPAMLRAVRRGTPAVRARAAKLGLKER